MLTVNSLSAEAWINIYGIFVGRLDLIWIDFPEASLRPSFDSASIPSLGLTLTFAVACLVVAWWFKNELYLKLIKH